MKFAFKKTLSISKESPTIFLFVSKFIIHTSKGNESMGYTYSIENDLYKKMPAESYIQNDDI